MINTIEFTADGPVFYLQDGTQLVPANISTIIQPTGNSLVNASYLIVGGLAGKKAKSKNGYRLSAGRKRWEIFYVNDDKNTKLNINQIISIEMA